MTITESAAPAGRLVPRLRPVRYEPDPDAAVPTPVPATPARGPAPDRPTLHEPGPDERAADDEALRRAHAVLRLALEVLDGRRPAAHLVAHVAPPALRYVRAAARPDSRPAPTPSRLTSLRVCRPRARVAEVAAVCKVDGRIRALAARFERSGDAPSGWRCTVLRLG